MKWVFVKKHFLNQRCCMHSTLSNTYTHNTAQYTHVLNPPSLPYPSFNFTHMAFVIDLSLKTISPSSFTLKRKRFF